MNNVPVFLFTQEKEQVSSVILDISTQFLLRSLLSSAPVFCLCCTREIISLHEIHAVSLNDLVYWIRSKSQFRRGRYRPRCYR